MMSCFFFFQAEDGIRDLVRSRGLGDVYKRQLFYTSSATIKQVVWNLVKSPIGSSFIWKIRTVCGCLLYTSDAADERSSVDLGGRRIIKKKNTNNHMTFDTSIYKINTIT